MPPSGAREPWDLLIRAGRLFCLESRLDGPGAVAVQGDRIAAAGPGVAGPACESFEFPDALLLPGLVDLHAHPARGESKYGVDPDLHFLPRGVTTVLSQGDAGAANWPSYRDNVIRASRIRVKLAINLAAPGESKSQGCFEILEDADVEACVRAIEDGREDIWGIAVNTSPVCCGRNDPDEILARAIRAAERTRRPLLFGSRRHADRPLADQLKRLRPGDVVTYCFHGEAEGLVSDRQVREEVWEARQRGVLFDIGHGMASFCFEVAEAAIAQGFFPDTISTDQYKRHVGSAPQHDLARTLSKLQAAGMPEREALGRVTAAPARVLGLAGEIGCLKPGTCADLAILGWNEAAPLLRDTTGHDRPGGCWETLLTVRAGKIVRPESPMAGRTPAPPL